jgi:DNA sulfur modification protein DndB
LLGVVEASGDARLRRGGVVRAGGGRGRAGLAEDSTCVSSSPQLPAAALKENPALAEETLSVLLFNYENRDRVQQMFSDLNRYVAKTSKSLDILYDRRDQNSRVALTLVEKVPAFNGLVDKEAISLPVRSPKLFTLSSIYDATVELLGEDSELTPNEAVARALEYWTAVSKMIPLWGKVKADLMKSVDMRQEYICAHSVVLRALGSVGADLFRLYPNGWKERLIELNGIDWRKVNTDWENICIVANSVVSNRQARLATKAYLKRKLGLELTDPEKRSLPALPEPAESKDGKVETAKK